VALSGVRDPDGPGDPANRLVTARRWRAMIPTMIFGPDLIPKVLDGRKTVTRRRSQHRDGRPLRYLAGGVYAVQPGRGQPHVGHIEVGSVSIEPLVAMTEEEARSEGFRSLTVFMAYWMMLHRGWNPDEPVVRIAFRRAPDCARCAEVLPP